MKQRSKPLTVRGTRTCTLVRLRDTVNPFQYVNRTKAMPAETHLFLCRSDNYGVLLHDPES